MQENSSRESTPPGNLFNGIPSVNIKLFPRGSFPFSEQRSQNELEKANCSFYLVSGSVLGSVT